MPRYIDAEKLPNAIGKALNKLDEEISPLVLTEVCISIGRAIKEAPTADVVEVKHGHWIKVGKTEGRSNILQCSVCSKVRRGIAKTPYCKDCGAKMDGGAE